MAYIIWDIEKDSYTLAELLSKIIRSILRITPIQKKQTTTQVRTIFEQQSTRTEKNDLVFLVEKWIGCKMGEIQKIFRLFSFIAYFGKNFVKIGCWRFRNRFFRFRFFILAFRYLENMSDIKILPSQNYGYALIPSTQRRKYNDHMNGIINFKNNDFSADKTLVGSRRWNWKFWGNHFWNPNLELLLHSNYSFWP